MLRTDAICALATPPGTAGLAVVRLSGDDAVAIADRCFRGKRALADAPSHTLHYGTFWRTWQDASSDHTISHDILVDTVVASVFRAPHSYTGEDVIEFGCHGGVLVSHELVEALIEAGARHAEPGEFTKRAFLNHKLDLTQAEAVGDMIHAVSVHGSHTAARQLMGGFTTRLAELREQLLQTCGLLELELDFSQEGLELVERTAIGEQLEAARLFCIRLADTHRSSEIVRSGYSVGIVGYPNAGKSSLMNALLGRTRALVSDVPGTTRDYLEEFLHISSTPHTIGSVAVKLIDTAGFRQSTDAIEVQGIRLAESLLEQCALILVLNDATIAPDHSEPLVNELRAKFPTTEFMLVQNKIDALSNTARVALAELSPEAVADVPVSATASLQLLTQPSTQPRVVLVSAQTGEGLEALKQEIAQRAQAHTQIVSDALINARQASLLRQAAKALTRALEALKADASNEFIAFDVREALRYIGEITGAVWNEEVLNAVFAKFCIGK
jgi:tRNA modification GTPase